MIRIEGISKKYNDFFALKNISLEIKKGEFVAITGNSGSGKSTLLNIIGQIEEPSTGKLYIENIDVAELSEKERNLLRNQKIGYIFQSFYLEPLYPVYKNIEIPLIIAKIKKNIRIEKIDEVLKLVGLTEKKNNKSSTLSGGEKQRIAIARALVCSPEIIIADEPCGNLDSVNSQIILQYLKNINSQGTTVILVTHNLEDVKYADRVIRLKDGEIVYDKKNF